MDGAMRAIAVEFMYGERPNMDNDKMLNELFPLPPGVKLHIRKFGKNPMTEMKTVPTADQGVAGEDHPPLTLTWEDETLGLSAVVSEDPATGKLTGHAFCTDPAMLNKASASVAVIGKREFEMLRKSINLNQPDPQTGGCCGSGDFGLLKDAVAKLGNELGLVVFLVMPR
jgi:hypothetical protein